MSRQRYNEILKLLRVPPDEIDHLMDANIQEEFNLIEVKKSCLPAKNRKTVVDRINYITTEVRKIVKY